MTRNKPVLDPYCTHCGSYKGIGFCRNKSCRGFAPKEKLSQAFNLTSSCLLCQNDALLSCTRCARKYCGVHSANSEESKFSGLNHHVGLCVICKVMVCENCWILDEEGNIQCIEHFEEG